MADTLPSQVRKYFWGDDLAQLNWQKHKKYIVETLLNKGDEEAVAWLLKKTGKAGVRQMMSGLNLEPRSENFWKVYLS